MQSGEEERPPGLKPRLISEDLRGPEGPLFHGDKDIYDFSRKLWRRVDEDGLAACVKACPDTNPTLVDDCQLYPILIIGS